MFKKIVNCVPVNGPFLINDAKKIVNGYEIFNSAAVNDLCSINSVNGLSNR